MPFRTCIFCGEMNGVIIIAIITKKKNYWNNNYNNIGNNININNKTTITKNSNNAYK